MTKITLQEHLKERESALKAEIQRMQDELEAIRGTQESMRAAK